MKGIVIYALLFICSTMSIYADYRIVFLNTPTIRINGKELRLNDTFNPEASVEWRSDRQAMKIVDTSTGEQRLLVASQYRKSKSTSVSDFIAGVKHLSSRGNGPQTISSLRIILNNHFFYTDSIRVESQIPTDDKRFFYVSYFYNGEEINKLVPNESGSFTISNDIFEIDGSPIDPFETTLNVYYLDEIKDTVTLVSDSMQITPIPDSL